MNRAVIRVVVFAAMWSMTLGTSAAAAAQTQPAPCTRENLKGTVDKYLAALTAHDPSIAPLASPVKFTENGIETAVGKGFWTTAGKVLLKRSALDPQTCGTVTEAIVEENGRPIIFGVRLKLEGGKIAEIEHIIAREKEFAFNAKGILETADQDWESPLKPGERSSRGAMTAAAVAYFDMFSKEPLVNTPFANPCDRWENGTQTTKGGSFQGKDYPPHDCSPKGLVINQPPRRVPVVDLDAGIAVAFIRFANNLPDFHMFKMRNGKVELINAVVGPQAPSTGWHEDLTSQ